MTLLPTPWPADPVEGEPGHFEHTLWVKAGLVALDDGKLTKPGGTVPAGRILATTDTNTWEPVLPTAVGGVPSGVIVAYNGGSTPPTGWAVCDGSNGTPDLRGKFVLAASASRAAGSSGGAESVTLSDQQSGLQAHSHTINPADAPHSHTIQQRHFYHNHGMVPNGGHNHSLSGDDNVVGKGTGTPFRRITGGGSGVFDGTGHVGNHDHYIHPAWDVPWGWTFPIDQANAPHAHSANPNSPQTAVQPHENMPPYYALVYIMKL